MIQVTLTKTGKGLDRKKTEYLDKDKKHINELSIQLNILKGKYKKDPTPELKKEIKKREIDIGVKYDKWKRREGFEIQPSGDIGVRLRRKGYTHELDKHDRVDMILDEWHEMMGEIKEKDGRHVKIRPFFISPDPKSMKDLSSEEKRDVMKRTTKDMMKKFKERFVGKGDNFSYIYSVHMDTDVPHAHIYLFPYTKKGEYLAMNADRYLDKKMRELTGKTILEHKAPRYQESKLKALEVMANNSYKKELRRSMQHRQVMEIEPQEKKMDRRLRL